jgi:hypothetical protein
LTPEVLMPKQAKRRTNGQHDRELFDRWWEHRWREEDDQSSRRIFPSTLKAVCKKFNLATEEEATDFLCDRADEFKRLTETPGSEVYGNTRPYNWLIHRKWAAEPPKSKFSAGTSKIQAAAAMFLKDKYGNNSF